MKYYSEAKIIPAKASLSLWYESEDPISQLEWHRKVRGNFRGLRINTIKLMMDGVIETKTAFCINKKFKHFVFIYY